MVAVFYFFMCLRYEVQGLANFGKLESQSFFFSQSKEFPGAGVDIGLYKVEV